jgi:geranylgeranyl diphosphate synthase type I
MQPNHGRAAEEVAERGIDLDEIRRRVDVSIETALDRARFDASAASPASVDLVDELRRLVGAGGRRVRPTLLVLGHVAAGGRVEDALPAAAGIELFHTFALVHDDVMDEEDERRGVPSTHRRFAEARGLDGAHDGTDGANERFGRAVAILVGDLAFALAVDLVLSAQLPAERVIAAARRLRGMSLATAAGQYLDLRGRTGADVASLKTGSYTLEAPLAIGAELAGAPPAVLDALAAFARPAGVAFQLLDDVADGSGSIAERDEALRLLDEAASRLPAARVEPAVARALAGLVERLRGTA